MMRKRRQPTSYHVKQNMIFGGYSIIFSGDFHQIPPVRPSANDLLYRGMTFFEKAINVAIVLNNSHRFKDDPKFGEILMRIWKGETNDEDVTEINKRVVGLNGLKIPEVSIDSDISYACPKNNERALVHAELFQKVIVDFPSVSSDDLPPENTVVLEADIRRAPDRKPQETRRKMKLNNQKDLEYQKE
jgi:hypothetical protein